MGQNQMPKELRRPLIVRLDEKKMVSDLKKEIVRRVGRFYGEAGLPEGEGRIRLAEVRTEGRRGKIMGKSLCCNFSHYMALYIFSIPCSISRSRGWFKAAVPNTVVG